MKLAINYIILICLFTASCGNVNQETVTTSEKVTPETHHHEEPENIELNNGEKWKVDENMIIHIRNMEKEVDSCASADQKDYMLLANKLQRNIDLLTSNCTMKGKAHDELHKWLLPYIDLVEELSEAKDGTEATNQFGKIQNSFKTFNQYFQ